jgi:hypothetical protein
MINVGHAQGPFRPTAAPPRSGSKWKHVSVVQDRVSIAGGYSPRGETAHSIQYQVGTTTHVFVELDKNATWFLKGVGGAVTRKGDLKPVAVMQLLRERLSRTLEQYDDTAVAEEEIVAEGGDVDDGADPMDAMDAMDVVAQAVAHAVPEKKAPKPKRKPGDLSRALVHNLTVPTRPRCVGCGEGETTVVCVYRPTQTNTRSNLYLRMDCIDWLLAYAADELALQGVESARSAPPPATGNCTAVADLHLEYDFSAKAWEGKFVAGPQKGTTKRVAIKDLDKDKWERLRRETKVQEYFSSANSVQRKNAAKELLAMWCGAIARDDSAELDAMMDQIETDSPPRGEKRPAEDDDHTAVAASEVCLVAAVAATLDDDTWLD